MLRRVCRRCQPGDDEVDGAERSGDGLPLGARPVRRGVEGGEEVEVGPELAQLPRVACSLEGDHEFLHRLQEGLRSLQLVDDALHVRLVERVAVEERRPLEGSIR